MKALVEQTNSYTRKVDVTVPAAEVDAAFDTAIEGLRGRVRMKGFRRGRVPAKVLYERYRQAVDGEVMGALLNAAVTELFERPDLEPISQPEIDPQPVVQGKDFQFGLTFEVLPSLELGELDALEVEMPPLVVSAEAVQERLDALRMGDSQERTVEDRTQPRLGDIVVFDQTVQREGAEPHTHAGATVHLEENGRLPEQFLTALLGATVDEPTSFSLDPPPGAEASGEAPPHIEVTVRQIKERLLPDIDDEWARDHDHDTLEEFQAATRAELLEQARAAREEKLDEAVLDLLVGRHDIEIPPGLAKRQVQQRVETLERIFAGGLSQQDPSGELFESMRRETRDRVHREIRRAIVLAAVCREQKIEVSDEQIAARVDKQAEESKEPAAKVRARLATSDARERLRTELSNEAALAFLKARTTIKEVEPQPEPAPEPEPADAAPEPALDAAVEPERAAEVATEATEPQPAGE